MIRLLYNLLFPVALLFFLPGYLVKMTRRGNYREKFGQRLGFYDRATRARLTTGRNTWMHAVSVGEVMIALKLAAQMKTSEPDLRVALTTTTTTGFALARARAADWIEVIYTPLDFWPVMRRAFAVVRPVRIVLVEAEVWPNLVAIAHGRKIPLALVNARLSARSEKRFRLFGAFVRQYFRMLDLICVQEREDVARWQSLGVGSARIRLVGSVKFDPEESVSRASGPRAVLESLGILAGRPILLGGSTHPGEEEILGRVLLRMRAEFPELFLIVAPRHVERAPEVASQLQKLGLRTVLRSETKRDAAPFDCLILDTTGELRDWYGVATIVFIGKSLTAHGGQNPVEAIVANRPVIFGPNMENFSVLAAHLVKAGGAFQPHDETGLKKTVQTFLRDGGRQRRAVVERAAAVLEPHRGATARTAGLLRELRAHEA